MGEMWTAAIIPPIMIMVGLGIGFVLLRLQGGEAE
jgi:uncharacterized membrane-anchored protein YhcB (DUF1043 family)